MPCQLLRYFSTPNPPLWPLGSWVWDQRLLPWLFPDRVCQQRALERGCRLGRGRRTVLAFLFPWGIKVLLWFLKSSTSAKLDPMLAKHVPMAARSHSQKSESQTPEASLMGSETPPAEELSALSLESELQIYRNPHSLFLPSLVGVAGASSSCHLSHTLDFFSSFNSCQFYT